MFYRYSIINNGFEDILYLYGTMKYEFSNEFNLEDEDLTLKTENFIKTNAIQFKGNKVCLVMDNKVVKCMYINNYQDDGNYYSDNYLINICLDDNALCEITLREYLLGVLFSKYLDSIHEETLKAMTVLYSTFAFKMMKENKQVLSTNRFAIYKPYTYYKVGFSNFDEIVVKLNKVINEVDGVFLSYNNDYILPFMHYSNSGRTLDNKHYPYLSSVKSLWDLASPYYIEVHDFSYEELNKKLNVQIDSSSEVNIVQGRNKRLKLGNHFFTLEEVKTILDLKSTDIYIIVNHKSLRIITKGWGNSYGLSIYGASEIAKNDCKYFNILKYYFPRTKLYRKINKKNFQK